MAVKHSEWFLFHFLLSRIASLICRNHHATYDFVTKCIHFQEGVMVLLPAFRELPPYLVLGWVISTVGGRRLFLQFLHEFLLFSELVVAYCKEHNPSNKNNTSIIVHRRTLAMLWEMLAGRVFCRIDASSGGWVVACSLYGICASHPSVDDASLLWLSTSRWSRFMTNQHKLWSIVSPPDSSSVKRN